MHSSFPKSEYNFKATALTLKSDILDHLKRLKSEQSYMFDSISIEDVALNPDAVNTLTVACETVALAVKGQDHFEKTGQPFYFGVGETHSYPDHTLHHIIVAGKMQEIGIPFIVSQELRGNLAHHFLWGNAKEDLGRDLTNLEKHKILYSANIDELRLISTSQNGRSSSPYAKVILTESLLNLANKGIRTKLTDAPFHIDFLEGKEFNALKIDDPIVSSILQNQQFQKLWDLTPNAICPEDFPALTDYGMLIRNEHSVKIVAPDKSAPRENVLHLGGVGHIISQEPAYNEGTLVACAKRSGFNPIGRPLIISSDDHFSAYDAFSKNDFGKRNTHPSTIIEGCNFSHIRRKSRNLETYDKSTFIEEEMDDVNPKLALLGCKNLIIPDLKALKGLEKKQLASIQESIRTAVYFTDNKQDTLPSEIKCEPA